MQYPEIKILEIKIVLRDLLYKNLYKILCIFKYFH
ncbi:hypothetical protein NIES23_42600 [Trichormus variabilis NIES-23]|uniref:Uncharacterized protein n=1 Tax=Trichormus variabilis NIES-23 TaxID=1973479 RepID=A0A1Z4KR82_ANAVA|nr:hypothetical protein NIES23_42600 [Trichormus variabilis NIES-23]